MTPARTTYKSSDMEMTIARQDIGYLYFITRFNGRTGRQQIGEWTGIMDDFGDWVPMP
jgi:hypothetical protein